MNSRALNAHYTFRIGARKSNALSDQLISWFDSLSKSADHLADAEDEKRLKDSFKALDKNIYALEENGRKLVAILKKTPLDQSAARDAIRDTRNALDDLKKQLHLTGLSLRSQYRQGGADAEKLISDAIDIRGAFLTNVEGEIERGHISEELISAGERAVNGQRTASVALIQVIDKMP